MLLNQEEGDDYDSENEREKPESLGHPVILTMRKNIVDNEKSCRNSRDLISAVCKKLETYKSQRT